MGTQTRPTAATTIASRQSVDSSTNGIGRTTLQVVAPDDSRGPGLRGADDAPMRPRRPLGGVPVAGLVLTDLAVLVATSVIAFVARYIWRLDIAGVTVSASIGALCVGLGIIALWMLLLSAFRTRDRRLAGVGGEEYRRLMLAGIVAGALVVIVSYVLHIELARGYAAIAVPLGLIGLAIGRKAWRGWLARRRAAGSRLTDVLVVGDLDDIDYVGSRVVATPEVGYRVAGIVTDCAQPGTAVLIGGALRVPVIAAVDDVVDAARSSAGIGAVVFAGMVAGGHERLRRLGWQLEDLGIELVVSSPLVDVSEARVHHRPVDGLPLMHVETPEYSRRFGKRVLDILGAGIGLVLLAPLFAVVALAIRLSDGGPVFFRQQRVGRDGSLFPIFKFRTMTVDAEDRIDELQSMNEGAGPLFKVRNDPRVTRVGSLLRSTSIDELPQLWNVLIGTMSLVGPRPALPREVAAYADFADRRLLVTPGMTGLWQVSGRSDLDWADGVRLDLHYVENWSFLHDLVILARTIPSVMRSRGAY